MIFFWGVLHCIDWSGVERLARGLHPVPVCASFCILLAGLWFNAWKVDALVGNPAFSVSESFRLNLIKLFFNNILPSGLGGEVSRTYYLGKWEASLGRGFAIVVFDRITTQAALCVYTTAALAVLLLHRNDVWIEAAAWLAGLAVFSYLVWAMAWTFARVGQRGFRDFHRELLGNKRLLLRMGWMSLANQLFWIARFYFLVRAFGLHVSLGTLSIVLSVSTLLSVLPISLGGLGLTEGVFATVFALTDSTKEAGFAVAVLGRLTSLVPALWGWGLFLYGRRNKSGVVSASEFSTPPR
jgi:uncharacterized membrane protein YbhN (UPF0104 family)